jgi:hypothetical protein
MGRPEAPSVPLESAAARRAFGQSAEPFGAILGSNLARKRRSPMPREFFPRVKVNVEAARLPRPRSDGWRYAERPPNFLRDADEVGAPRAA